MKKTLPETVEKALRADLLDEEVHRLRQKKTRMKKRAGSGSHPCEMKCEKIFVI